ncbi:thioesterase domain-containing protein [Pseudoalteromonas piscicida]
MAINKAIQLLEASKNSGVILFVEDGKLGYKVKANGCFDSQLKQEIVANKGDIVALLSSERKHAVVKLGDGAKTDLFFVLGAGMSSASLLQCAKPLADAFNINVLEDPSFTGAAPFHTFADMVACYTHNVVETVHNETVNLIGFSMGGTVAFELAIELEKQGKKVNLLLIDSLFTLYEYAHENSTLQDEEVEGLDSIIKPIYLNHVRLMSNYKPSQQFHGQGHYVSCLHGVIALRRDEIEQQLNAFSTKAFGITEVESEHLDIFSNAKVDVLSCVLSNCFP